MFIGSAHATEMCAKNNTIVVPLDATVNATSYSQNGTEYMWWRSYSYGKVYGLATALSLQEVREIENNPGLTGFPEVLNTDSDELIGRSGTDANGNKRSKCYCKLTHPMSSNWIFLNCPNPDWSATYCASGADTRVLLSTIGASMAE